jgi:8-oxo-dGTP pyrophosphatase MutT (NUDIX family)
LSRLAWSSPAAVDVTDPNDAVPQTPGPLIAYATASSATSTSLSTNTEGNCENGIERPLVQRTNRNDNGGLDVMVAGEEPLVRCALGCHETNSGRLVSDVLGVRGDRQEQVANYACSRGGRLLSYTEVAAKRLVILERSAMPNQVVAIPVRRSGDGMVQVFLVTSRETHRWVIPKGWPWPNVEAWEEAGVRGSIIADKIGSFTYHKRREGELLQVEVVVFLLEVTEQAETWPEINERRRDWFSPAEAAKAVDKPQLKALLRALDTV